MDPPDDDIQFDFFEDEPPTAESAPREPRRGLPQRPAREPRVAGAPRSLKPTGTLGLFVLCVVIILLIFALLISSCGASRHSTYLNYVGKVQTIATQSTNDGKQTVQALTTPGLSVNDIVKKLDNIAAEEQQNVQAAEGLSAPGHLRSEHLHLIESLQLRVSGVGGLAKAFHKTVGSKAKQSVEAAALSGQAYRLLASDIVWDDEFQKPAQDEIDNEGVRQVTVPGSTFLSQPDSFISPSAMSLVLDRLSSSGTGSNSTPTGLHGTNIDSVAALPNGAGGSHEDLVPGQLNTVTTSSSLLFQVTISDGGISQEVGIKVTLTIERAQSSGGPITKTVKIPLIDPGQTASATFGGLGEVPFAAKTKVTVDVAGVPGETNLSNNHAEYDVIFSLPQ
ncbi:MAG TPA: hypothetical protein VG265_00470 [Gaiellaceae bacterium]|jgi:hypothetical protein|nr:hypothetical protein [Gaiellaceae bacterium]